MGTKAPEIHRETRIPRIRTSVSLPEDVLAWADWMADRSRQTRSAVMAEALRRWASEEGAAAVRGTLTVIEAKDG